VTRMNREGYSKSFTFDNPQYFEDHQDFEEIEDNVYEVEMRDKSAIVIYHESDGIMDIVGESEAVRGTEYNHRQAFGANVGFNNGVGDHYDPERAFESEDTIEALQEFGVDVEGFEAAEKERTPAASD